MEGVVEIMKINILIVDERNEICSCVDGEPALSLGGFCDIIANCNKRIAFKNGIRSMSPDVIVTDELDLEKDLEMDIDWRFDCCDYVDCNIFERAV